ncbi:MAG: outer-membrane lipoprotein carrier protein LolA, partial [Spirochaetales bacterium]|nr:outer-membrane lipoprotein carrier protein LolA [Spirochaetales bacterium]
FVVTKTAKAVTYQREKMAPIRVDLSDTSAAGQHFDIIALFGDDEQVKQYYDIAVTDEGGVSHYTITPKNESKIRQMNALAVGDKLSSLIIFYNDGSTLKYTFRNTVTGTKPADYEKYFK